MNRKSRTIFLIIDLLLAAVLVFIDRLTKNLAYANLKDKDPIRLIPDVFEFRYLENRGAAFGMLQNMKVLFVIVGIVFIGLVVYFLIRLPATKKYRALRICLVLIGAGAVGNLYDRLVQDYVIDFLYFIYIDFPIFNVADIYVTCSAVYLIILFLFIYKDDDIDLKKANTVKLHSSMVEEKEDREENEDKEDREETPDGE
ncbi:MAG: signal peptidase II [Lachnospiraceae bacterium]|nr:signal peptidase II [Lachnospiraceae bacterium]